MFIVTGLLVIELVIFAFTPEMGMYAYGVMMVIIYFTFPGTQALLPSCTAQTFGPTFTSSNYGMIYWATVSQYSYKKSHSTFFMKNAFCGLKGVWSRGKCHHCSVHCSSAGRQGHHLFDRCPGLSQ